MVNSSRSIWFPSQLGPAFTRLDDLFRADFKWRTRLESHSSDIGSGLKASTATPSSQFWDKRLRRCDSIDSSGQSKFILENNLPAFVFVKGTISTSSIRCKILLQSSFISMHWKTFCHTSKYLILLLLWFLTIGMTSVFNISHSLVTFVISHSLLTRSSLKCSQIFPMVSLP